MTFPALASIAAVGTGQRSTLPSRGALAAYLPAVDEADPQATAYALLDAAAASAVVRRGTLPLTYGDPLAAAPADPRPEPPAQVVSIVAQMLADDAGMIRLSADRVAVLAEALGLVATAGMRLPHRVLPSALARRDLRPLVRPVLGLRGEWLLGQLCAAGLDGPEGSRPDPSDTEVWETGTSDQRIAWFWQARAADPDAARATLEGAWGESPAAFRAELLRGFAADPYAPDEPFLEHCLDDRAESVRTGAREALARLPESAYVARMVNRARSAVSVVESTGSGLARLMGRPSRTVMLTPPTVDDAAARDGIGPKLSTVDRLITLVAAVPPAWWPEICGTTAAELITGRQDEPRWNVIPGLVAATVRNHDAVAATALATAGIVEPHLIPLLPEPVLAEVFRTLPTERLAPIAGSLQSPWPHDVATLVGQRLVSATGHQVAAEVWGMFARSVPLRLAGGWAQRLRSLGEADSRTTRNLLRDTVSVLTVRALIGDALRPFLPESAWQDPQSGASAPQGGRP